MQAIRDPAAIRRKCTRFLAHHYPLSPKQHLQQVADAIPDDMEADTYGSGAVITAFEAEVAQLLGKEAAVFMPSGTMCQQIALRVWSERRGFSNIAMHPQNHLDKPEKHGYLRLHGLTPLLVGNLETQLNVADVEAISEPVAALFLELPQREIGGTLPTWGDLTAMTTWARDRGIPVHMDGARLWECGPYYAREYREIAALFDTVYVSFYKVLGGIAGAALAGPADVIAAARVWQRRHGGNLIRLYPYVVAARLGLQQHLPRMGEYVERAKQIGAILAGIPGIEIAPEPPQTNMMHVFLQGDISRLQDAALDISEREYVAFWRQLQPTVRPRWQRFELSIGNAALDIGDNEIDRWFREIIEHGQA